LSAVIATSERLACAAIGYAELRAAVARAVRTHRIAETRRTEYVQAAEDLWQSVHDVPVETSLIRRAGNLADLFDLRGYDAVHLACLQSSGDPEDIIFACWDRSLRRAADGLGYELVPQRL